MKKLIVLLITLFAATTFADKTYDNELKRLEAAYSKAKLKAANAYLQRLHAAQRKAMKGGDLKKANALQAEIDKLKKTYAVKKKAPKADVPAPGKKISEDRASFTCASHKILTCKIGGLIFSDRDYKFTTIAFPEYVFGKQYIQSSCGRGMGEVICTQEGVVYAITASDRNSQLEVLKKLGFVYVERVGTNHILKKQALKGERISLKRWGYLVF